MFLTQPVKKNMGPYHRYSDRVNQAHGVLSPFLSIRPHL